MEISKSDINSDLNTASSDKMSSCSENIIGETSKNQSELSTVSDDKENSYSQNTIEKNDASTKKVVEKRKCADNHRILNQKRKKAVLDKQVSFSILQIFRILWNSQFTLRRRKRFQNIHFKL